MILYKNKKLVIPTGINPHYLPDSPVINNQDKTVDITENGKTTIVHDPGFSGLGTVTVNTYVGEVKVQPFYSTKFTENGEFDIFPDAGYDAIAEVEIEVDVQPDLDAKTVDSSTNEQIVTSDKDGLSSVTVNPYTLDEKTVDSSTNPQVVTSDADGLSKVTINPYTLSPLELDSSTAIQTRLGEFSSVTVNPYVLDSSSAVYTENGEYVFTSAVDGLSRVDVSVNIDTQSYYDSGYRTGEAVGIEEGIAEQKAKLESIELTINGTYTRPDGWNEVKVAVPGINNQNKTVDSSTVQQTVTFDSGYTGLGTVTINPYFLQNKTSGVVYEYLNSDTRPGYINVTPDSSYNGLSLVTIPKAGILSSKTFTPTTSQQTWDAYDDTDELVGLKTVVVSAVTSSIDSNIKAGNIKRGITILGVQGTFDGGTLQSKSVDSSTRLQTVTPSTGYYGISSVTINPYVLDSKTVDASTNSITVTSSANGLSSVNINAVTSSIDSNIIAGNIKKDVVILGVTGTYEGSEPTPSAVPVEYISNEDDLNLVFNSGYIPNDNTKIIARLAWGGEGLGSWGNYFGVQNNFALREWGGYGSASGEITWQTIGGTCAVQNVYTTPGDITIIRDIEVGNNYVNADSSSGSTGQYSGWISDYPMFIFGACDPGNGQLTELSSREMRIHSFAIYEGTTLMKNLVPYQDASSNGCFYDTVSDTFIYPLQGTPTVGPVAIYQQKVVDASLNAIEVTADAGFEALSKVTVNGVTSAVDPNIIPGNIKAGVSILGVGGSFSGAIYHRVGYVANDSTNKKIFRNTGIIPTNNTRIEATISFDDTPTGEGGYGYFYGTTSGASFVVREFGGYGSRNVSYVDGNGTGYYSSDMSSAPRTYVCGQVENDYSFMSYGGYIDKRTTWSHTWSTGDEIFIWAGNKGNSTVDEYATRVMRVYDFKIYEGDTLVFHGVPAADNDGSYVLLDLVSNTMVDGSGTLTGGGVYVEVDEDNYVENGTYDRTDGTVYFNLGDQLNLYDLSDSNNVKEYFEIVASVPKKNTGSSNGFQYIASNLSRSESYFGIGMYGYTSAMFYTQSSTSASTSTANSPGMHKYTLMGYKNNNSTYYGGWICGYIDDTTVAVVQLTLSNTLYSGDVYLFTANTNGAPGSTYMCTKGTRIYQIRYYKPSDGLVHVLVPAYNNGQYCFHDLISDTYLYAAAGTPTGHLKDKYLPNNGAINVYNG